MTEEQRKALDEFLQQRPDIAPLLQDIVRRRRWWPTIPRWARDVPFWLGAALVGGLAVRWTGKIITDIDMHGPHVLTALIVGAFCGWLMMAAIRLLFHREGWIDEYERDEAKVSDPVAKLLPHAVMTLATVLGFVIPFAAVLSFWDQT